MRQLVLDSVVFFEERKCNDQALSHAYIQLLVGRPPSLGGSEAHTGLCGPCAGLWSERSRRL